MRQWVDFGQSKVLAPPWIEDQSKSLLEWNENGQVEPYTQAIMLGIEVPDAVGNHLWRWRLAIGVGGARQVFLIDAIGVQQITVPATAIGISLSSQRAFEDTVYDAPNYDVRVLAYHSYGTTVGKLATFTDWFATPTGAPGTEIFVIPAGAIGWKLLGDGDPAATSHPFVATVRVTFSPFTDAWLGTQLLDLHSHEGYLPIPGGSRSLILENTSGATKRGAIQWEIDF